MTAQLSNPMASAAGHHITPARLMWILDIGESTEAEWRRRKLIAHFKIGRVIRYSPEAVCEFISRNTIKARNGTQGTNGTYALSTLNSPDSQLLWQRIERLIADQVSAQLRAGGLRVERKEAA